MGTEALIYYVTGLKLGALGLIIDKCYFHIRALFINNC